MFDLIFCIACARYGLFEEHGPIGVLPDGSGLFMRNVTWTNEYNVMYIDNPVGTGFSYTDSIDGFVTNQEEVGQDLLSFLTQFYELYPKFQQLPLYICGQTMEESRTGGVKRGALEADRRSIATRDPTDNLFVPYCWLCALLIMVQRRQASRMRVSRARLAFKIGLGQLRAEAVHADSGMVSPEAVWTASRARAWQHKSRYRRSTRALLQSIAAGSDTDLSLHCAALSCLLSAPAV